MSNKLTDKLSESAAVFNERILKLEADLEAKEQINKKWSTETKSIAESFEKMISHLKKKLTKANKTNETLTSDLETQKKKCEQYKKFVQILTEDAEKICQMASENIEDFLIK